MIYELKLWWTLIIGDLRFRIARKKADLKHKTTGKRYYVVPNGQNRLMVLCKADINPLKKAGIIRKDFNHLKLMDCCLYFTDLSGKDEGRMDKKDVEVRESWWRKHLSK